ncbi:MAG: hypothetical protein HC881_13220 [Leptolyngbyaceae cyanobacterium SL_7_1]|nr:hypothetical protein [Leptolyngbyaceae cyanobacterium SL_7_1]
MTDKFPTAFYEANDVLTCPNGDKLRSDDEGVFCLVEGERIAAEVVNGRVKLIDRAIARTKKPVKEQESDANG